VQIASTTQPAVPSTTAGAGSVHVVSPSRLFHFARIRFEGAAAALRPDQRELAPSALGTSIAIGQVESGINALRSSLIPATPFELRKRAVGAMDQADEGIALLHAYRAAVQPFGDQHLPINALQDHVRGLLDAALMKLDAAAAVVRDAAQPDHG
jgi:hypothetical protein